MNKEFWIRLALNIVPIVISIINPKLAPLSNQLASAIASAEDTDLHGDDKLQFAMKSVQPKTVHGLDEVSSKEIRDAIQTSVETVNAVFSKLPQVTNK
jgi:hypothetical protein